MSWKKDRTDEVKATGLSLWYVFLSFVLLAAICAGSLGLYKVFAPADEAARRETVEQSKSFIDGTVRDLENLRIQYNAATSQEEKTVLRGTILQRASAIHEDRLPADLRQFIRTLKEGGIQ